MNSLLRSVIRHEYMTIVKQPSFWIVMVAIPALIAAAIALSYFGGKASEDRIDDLAKDLKNVSIVDQSGLIAPQIVAQTGLTISPSDQLEKLKTEVREQRREALVVYPADLAQTKNYDVYVSNNDLTKASTVTSLSDTILEQSVFAPLGSSDIVALAKDGAESQLTTYENGRETAGFNEYIVPGIFVILFYIIFAFSVGYMLNSVSEEKENRSMEMVLTYVKPRTLILGKLLAVMLVTLTQVAFFAALGLLALAVLLQLPIGRDIQLPAGIELSKLVFDSVTIMFAVAYLFVGFLMFAGFMTITAAAAPSTREANSFSAVFYIGAFAPFYIVTLLLTDPDNPITKFVTFFPLTSPVVTLIRNTVGNMSLLEASLALAVMVGFMLLTIGLAIRTFRLGALEFTSRIKFAQMLKR